MSKKILYWIVGVVVVAAVVFVAASAGMSPTKNVTHTTAAVARQTLHDLISSSATQTCTFSIAATATSSGLSGTIYMASGSMSGDFVKTSTAGKATSAHMIVANGEDYLWSDALSRGIKMPWSAANSAELANKYGSIDTEQPTAYTCASWTPDQSKFTLPTGIQFIDVSKLMH